MCPAPRIPAADLPDQIEGTRILVRDEIGGEACSFVGRCEFQRRRIDNLVRVVILLPDPPPGPPFFFKLTRYIAISKSDLALLTPVANAPHQYEFDLLRRRTRGSNAA